MCAEGGHSLQKNPRVKTKTQMPNTLAIARPHRSRHRSSQRWCPSRSRKMAATCNCELAYRKQAHDEGARRLRWRFSAAIQVRNPRRAAMRMVATNHQSSPHKYK